MAIHEELNPDDAALPFMAARANRLLGTDNAARTAGVIVVPNLDGSETVLGVNGVAPWVGDTTPPGRPLDIEATSHLGTALIRWGGQLEGGIPTDFRCVQIWAKPVDDATDVGTLVGALSSAGEVNTGVFEAGTVLDVWATALDNAHDRDGSPAYNESAESAHVQVEILPIVTQQEFDESAANILAAADESVKAQIDRVDADLAAANEAIDKKAEETLAAANKTAQDNLDRVQEELAGEGGRIEQAANAAYDRAKEYADTIKTGVDVDLESITHKINKTAEDTLFAAKQDTERHIAQVNKDIEAASKKIDETASKTLADANAAAQAKVDAVSAKVDAAQAKADANAAAIEQTSKTVEANKQAADEAMAELDKTVGEHGSTLAQVDRDLAQTKKDLATVEGKADSAVSTANNAGTNAANAVSMAATAADNAASAVEIAKQSKDQTVVGSVIEYAIGGATAAPTSGWTTGNVTRPAGATVWMRTRITYGDGRTMVTGATPVTGDTGPKGPQGVAGATGVSVTAITTYYQLALSAPAKPEGKAPEGGWSLTEPAYVKARSLYTVSRVDYSNGQWSWTDVVKSSAYEASAAAITAAEDAQLTAGNAQTTANTADRNAQAAMSGAATATIIANGAAAEATQAKATADSASQAATSTQRALDLARQNAAELLFNGGFEQGPDGWKTNIADAAFAQRSAWCRSGVYRAYLNGAAGTCELVSEKPVAVTVGHLYRFSVWYKLLTALSGNDDGGLRFQYATDAEVFDSTVWRDFMPQVNMMFTGDTWTQAEQIVTIPDGVKWVRARIAFTAPVDAYFDDCSIIDYTHIHELEKAAEQAQKTAEDAAVAAANADAKAVAADQKAIDAGDAAVTAQTTADSKNRVFITAIDPAEDPQIAGKLKPGDLWWQTCGEAQETYWEGTPNNSVSVLVDRSDEIMHMWIWNGARWNNHVLYAQDMLVNGSIVAELLAVDCVEARHISVGAIEADKLAATALYGKVIKGGRFLTANERLIIDDSGLLLRDSGGNATITMLASDGSATLRDVLIVGGTLTTPTLTAGEISGGTIDGAVVTGSTVQTVHDANRGIKLTGGNFDIYRSNKTRFLRANESGLYINDGAKDVLAFFDDAGTWKLKLAGPVTSGGEISGATITGGTIQTNADANRGIKLVDGNLDMYRTDKTLFMRVNESGLLLKDGARTVLGFAHTPHTYWEGEPNNSVSVLVDEWTLTLDGAIQSGGEISGATITGGTVQTSADANRGIKLVDNNLDMFTAAGALFLQANEDGVRFKDAAGVDKATFTPDASGVWNLRLNGMVSTGGEINGGTVTGATVQTNADANRGIKLTDGNLDAYTTAGARFMRLNEAGMWFHDGTKDVLAFARKGDTWTLSLAGAIQSGGEISGATVVGGVIRTNTQWESTDPAEKYRGLVITDGGMFAYKNNGKEEYSMAFDAATGELKLDGAVSTNAVFNAPTITAGQIIGSNIYTSGNADNRVSIDSSGLTVTRDGNVLIAFTTDGRVDLGTSGIASDEHVAVSVGNLSAEVSETYTPISTFDEKTSKLSDAVDDLQSDVAEQDARLADEIDHRRQYMRFDPDTGLMIGDMSESDAYLMRLTSTRLEFRSGDSVAAYVSNERLNILNAEILSTLRIGAFAFLPRQNGHMSLQYVGAATAGEE